MAERKKKGSKSGHTASKKDVSDNKRQLSKLASNLIKMKSSIANFSGKL